MSEQSDQPGNEFSLEEAMSVVVYVDDFQAAADYYTRILGLKVYGEIGENSCFLYLGDNPNGIYLEGGYSRPALDERSARLSFMLSVDSVLRLYERLKAESVRCVQDAPKQMGKNAYWLQFYDPAGNILEVVGKG